ncbi:MAG: SpoIIE family protein phosphatase, partial [Clostridia bacterium]|nr:SpoIIE family protein phosphatase [Clostridia bacterium]
FMPQSEAALSRNVAVGVTTIMQIVVFASLFIMIFLLVRRLVVDNIYKINRSLSSITEGNLDTVVDVRSHVEFDALSNDINSTVDTLKRYISDAAARIDAELAFAKAIQHSALPSVFPPYPNHTEFDIQATMYTAKEVGGDFYDFYFVDEDTLAFLVADVSGKGIPAAMFMMTSKTLLKSYAESGMSVEEVFTNANEKLCEGNDAGMFVTAWMGFLNIRTGNVTFANAGHNPPAVKHADGSFTYLRSRPGLVLAGMEGIRYRKNELQLEPGDVLYLYTDGVTEATNLRNELYGEERLLSLLNQNAGATPKTVCDAVKADVDAFVGDAPQFDDITMLTIQYDGSQEKREEESTCRN